MTFPLTTVVGQPAPLWMQILCWFVLPRLPVGTLLFGIQTDRRRLAFSRRDGARQSAWEWLSDLWDVVRNPCVVSRQRRQAICNSMLIRAVEFIRRWIVRLIAPQRP